MSNVFSTAVRIGDTVNKQILQIEQTNKNPNWWEADKFLNAVEELNSGLPRTNPDSNRGEDLNQGPPDFKSRTLNHSATPPPHV